MDLKTQITPLALQAIEDKIFPGCVVGIVTKNGERQILPFGKHAYDESSPSVKENTIYDMASVTKAIPTASLALQLIDEGKLKLNDKLIDYVPEFRNSDRENVLIKHLLTYSLDGYGLASLRKDSFQDLEKILLTQDFEKRPGTVFKYTNIPIALLRFVIERLHGETIDSLADKHFFKPLLMNRSTFYPEKFSKEEIAPTEINDWRGLVHGVVHDESTAIFKEQGKISGYAGLFSTAPDILNFLEMLLHKGTLDGRQYFSEKIISEMNTNQIPELNDFMGLGWELNQPRFMGEYCTPNTFGKTGFTGTLCVCDIEKGIAYVILSNRTFPSRPTDATGINKFRKTIGEIILKA